MKLLKGNKYFSICILAYLIGQLSIWYIGGVLQPIILVGHELLYIIAIVISCLLLVKKSSNNKKKLWWQILLIFLVTNLLLFLYWIFTVHLNPDINWKLQGNDYEVDPWYYILYLPGINFLLAFLIISIVFLYSSLRRDSFANNKLKEAKG